MDMHLKGIRNITHPGEQPVKGDEIEVECVGGVVCEVDPVTYKATETPKRFVITDDGGLNMSLKMREKNRR